VTDQPAYATGALKRDPVTKAVAIRTQFPEDMLPELAWLVATTNIGARNARSSDVADWDDLDIPASEQ